MPQANARIWDENGNVIIGEDPGTKLALGFLDKLNSEGLLYKTNMMQQPLYEATDEGKIATFYIGAFWDEFIRGNLTKTAGDWRVMKAPIFKEIGTGGAPVSTFFCLIDTHDDKYTGLITRMWYDFATDNDAYKKWVDSMMEQNGPYNNPISLEMLADPYWQESSDFYGGQSFRKAESDALANPSKNMIVTPQDAEADGIISAEIEKYVAGEQSIEQAIQNMQEELNSRIGQAEIP
jgi:multiple sugar transport system substrate-binding protein